jgi:uncharacterized peroxidase-related enzyme
MSTFTLIAPETAEGRAQELLALVRSKLGIVPNMTRAMVRSPAVLDAYLQMNGALAQGALPTKTRELIALTVAEANHCEYCLAAHSVIGKSVGLALEQITAARSGRAADASTATLLQFARVLVEKRGQVDTADLAAVRAAGFGDDAVAEVVANVALNVFTNYFNLAAGTTLDFPPAPKL